MADTCLKQLTFFHPEIVPKDLTRFDLQTQDLKTRSIFLSL